jgi:signal peptidase
VSTVTTGTAITRTPPHRRSVWRILAGVAAAIVRIGLFATAGFAVAISAAVTVPSLFGYTALDELSGSMTPTIRVGDEVIEQRIATLRAKIGDIVTFKSPDDGKILTHRVVQMRVHGSSVAFMTRGDANSGFEQWAIPEQGTIGKVVARIPKLGYITNRAGSRMGRVGLIALPVLLLGMFELWRIWRPRDDGASA